ncbi:MAG: hypothetical protein A3J46_02680 [Candidatus Yanofskybacteria bacterium RIFCSPHIGHO2_02_FULL_41_11]|uniref:DUF2157 domain-containing protein n=1 Tax=Candidatus Yanofskybacteria bacterium RIFCSPHIGHO2_02_FULL_41_11 TaxID=1802675 RepID=A0A1F8FAX2_9BACT|nr:MAG: hypothetical protein A3J46_02680 [Candidatus Yanofskybacteria bacterium RIFCSPHIGHO2_02_FULL_41_11]
MQKLGLLVGLIVSFLLFATPSWSQDIQPLSPEKLSQLVAIRNGILTLEDNVSAGIITKFQEEQGTKRYLEQASQLTGYMVTKKELFSFQDPGLVSSALKLTPLQKFAGLVTFVNILWVFAIVGLVGCGTYLFGDFLVNVLKDIPTEIYEGILYVTSIALAVYGKFLSPEIDSYVGLTGCLLLAGALVLTNYAHKLKENYLRFWAILFVSWTAAALVYQSQMIGFIAVGALMSVLGLSAMIYPFMVVIGFKDQDSLGKTTTAAFAIILLYTASIVFNLQLSIVNVFQSGALFLGSFVGYLGLDIASTRWYDGRQRNYALFQVVTIAAGFFAIYVGSVYGIGELQKIGGTFLVLFFLTKLTETPIESRRGYAVLGLFSSALIYGFCVYAKSHPDAFGPYLFLVS